MHKKNCGIFILTIILFNAALIFGQEKSLEKSTFESVVDRATKKLIGKTYRSTSLYEVFEYDTSTPAKSVKSITEQVPPDRFRWLSETAGQKIETIRIGGKSYKRENDGQWILESGAGAGAGMGCGASMESESYKVSEKVQLNGAVVNLYEGIERWKSVYCGSNDGDPEVWTKRFWISTDGLLLKTEDITEIPDKKFMRRNVTVYEYDLKIKIEAPVKP